MYAPPNPMVIYVADLSYRMSLRRSALRLLSSPSTSFLSKPRSITTVTPPALRIPRQSTATAFQRRWATNEAEAKEETENPPISEFQPTPQQEVENAIQSDNAADTEAVPSAETQGTQAAETAHQEQSAVDSAVTAATGAASSAASTVREAAQSATEAVSGSSRGGRDNKEQSIGTPKSTIYIGNLFFDVTENDLVKELARFGTITRCRLMRDSRGLSKG